MPGPIHTRRGDAGETRNLAGATMEKRSLDARALGALDELNAAIGLARVRCPDAELASALVTQQRRLFRLGSLVASYPRLHNHDVTMAAVAELDAVIDHWASEMPPLGCFVIPGASEAEARLHVARTVCRRAERELSDWLHEKLAGGDAPAPVAPALADALAYMNRLSDFLFAAARLANHRAGVEDDRVS